MTSKLDIVQPLEEKKLTRLKLDILMLERDNLRTREFTNEEMIEKIRKMIEEEVMKCY